VYRFDDGMTDNTVLQNCKIDQDWITKKKKSTYYNTKFCFLFNFIWLLYGASFSKIDQAVQVQDLSQNEIFDFDL